MLLMHLVTYPKRNRYSARQLPRPLQIPLLQELATRKIIRSSWFKVQSAHAQNFRATGFQRWAGHCTEPYLPPSDVAGEGCVDNGSSAGDRALYGALAATERSQGARAIVLKIIPLQRRVTV